MALDKVPYLFPFHQNNKLTTANINNLRAAYWRWAEFLALSFNRRTVVEFCTSIDTKPFSPPIADTML